MRSAEETLFIVAASSRLARSRVERLVVSGVVSLRAALPAPAAAFVDANRQADGRLHAWSIRDSPSLVNHWRRIAAGDWVLFYQMGYISAAARVSQTIESDYVAGGIWGPGEAQDLRWVIAFDEVWPVWAKVWPHSEQLGARFLGFRRLADDRQDALRAKYGSVEAFVRQQVLPHKSDHHAK